MGTDALTPELVMQAYAAGAFPMAPDRDAGADQIHWYRPDPRAVLPLDERFRVRRSLRQRIARGDLRITRDQAFDAVIDACAQPRSQQQSTWISQPIMDVYRQLHRRGVAHSVEAWRDDDLVGGLYGVSLGGAFFGESMFSRVSGASQVCLVHLVEHLRARGFVLLDVQFTNPHLEQFGVIELPCDEYLGQLQMATWLDVRW